MHKRGMHTGMEWTVLMVLLLAGTGLVSACSSEETETVYINAAQGSLSASAAEQNDCFETCVAEGEEPGQCRLECYEASAGGVDACVEGCISRGGTAEECRLECAEVEEIREDEESSANPMEECIRECMEDEGGGEECREQCTDA